MYLDNVIGQQDAKRRLTSELEQGRVPHALMLCGPEGCGAMALAVEYARMLLASQGVQLAESALAKLQHPDLHFAFPIYKKNSGKATYCDEFLPEWRSMLLNRPYFGLAEWMAESGAENQQLQIYADESDAMTRKLQLKSNMGGYKVLILWLPEKMNEACANKLLKLLEEPPEKTVFLLVSEEPERVLLTIRSRAQMIQLPRLTDVEVQEALVSRFGVQADEAKLIAHSSNGNLVKAQRLVMSDADTRIFFDMFVLLMRLAYMRDVKEMKLWSEKVAGMGRERIKAFLEYCQRMVRENFMYNFQRHDELNYMSSQEAAFAVKFAPFINENNVIGIMEELSLAQRDVIQNTSAKIVFFDFALKMIVLIKNR